MPTPVGKQPVAVSKRSYELPMLAHATLEPQNCTVEFREDGCHVYAPTQVQQMAQGAAAKAAGLPPEKVFVHTTFLGGGFGRRLDVDFVPAAVECAKAVNKPVKMLWTREDDTTHDKYRPPARNYVVRRVRCERQAGHSEGALWSRRPSLHDGRRARCRRATPIRSRSKRLTTFPYDVPNLYIDYLQHEVGIDVGYWRSVSHALNCFTVESFMDELATEAQMDPVEFRRSLLGKEPRWLSVLDAATRKANWGRPPEGRYQGVALMSGYDTYLAQVAEISLDGDKLKVHRIVCAIDCGQMVNPGIVQAQAEGSIVFGLTAALFGEINVVGGKVQEQNFDTYRLLRMNEAPVIEVHLLNTAEKPGGMGEPATRWSRRRSAMPFTPRPRSGCASCRSRSRGFVSLSALALRQRAGQRPLLVSRASSASHAFERSLASAPSGTMLAAAWSSTDMRWSQLIWSRCVFGCGTDQMCWNAPGKPAAADGSRRRPSSRLARATHRNISSSATVNAPLTCSPTRLTTNSDARPTARPSASVRLSRPMS